MTPTGTTDYSEFDALVSTLLDKQKHVARLLRVGAVLLGSTIVAMIALTLYLQTQVLKEAADPGPKIPDAEVIRIIREANVSSSVCTDHPGPQTVAAVEACMARLQQDP